MVDDIRRMLRGCDSHPRSALLQQIDQKSDLLLSQLVDFKNLIRDRKIVSFFETEQTRQLEWVSKLLEVCMQLDGHALTVLGCRKLYLETIR
jgi:hypothetical protein